LFKEYSSFKDKIKCLHLANKKNISWVDLPKLEKLKELDLRSCKSLTDQGLANILDKCPNLTEVNLSKTNVFSKDKYLNQRYKKKLDKREIR